jgi:hypothetical protein
MELLHQQPVSSPLAGRSDLNAVFTVLQEGCMGHISPAVLYQNLSTLNALDGDSITKFSHHILDTLPKIMRLSSKAAAETISDQLASKLASHDVLLQCLNGGVLQVLPPPALRSLFEDGQRLAALIAIHALDTKILSNTTTTDNKISSQTPLGCIVDTSGTRCMASVNKGGVTEQRQPRDIFYACPSISSKIFFSEITSVANGVINSLKNAERASLKLETLSQLSSAVLGALSEAAAQRQHQQRAYPTPMNAAATGVGLPEWSAADDVCTALLMLAEATIHAHDALELEGQQNKAQQQEACVLLFDLSERTLAAYAAAIASVQQRGQKVHYFKVYSTVRERTLGPLTRITIHNHQQATASGNDNNGSGSGAVAAATAMQQLAQAEALSEAHCSYNQLFQISEYLQDRKRLYNHMMALTGDQLNPPFSRYVFQRLVNEGRCSELLDLPDMFDTSLRSWLNDCIAQDGSSSKGGEKYMEMLSKMRWLHEIKMGDYDKAAEAMKAANSGSSSDSSRGVALHKLAALAGRPDWPLAATRNTSS